MSVGLKSSTLETVRKRTHGEAVLECYELKPDGDVLLRKFTLSKGFLIGRNSDTQEGAPEHLLTLDLVWTPELTFAQLERIYMFALVNPTSGIFTRYLKTTMTEPLIDDWRYVCGLHPRSNDARTIEDASYLLP